MRQWNASRIRRMMQVTGYSSIVAIFLLAFFVQRHPEAVVGDKTAGRVEVKKIPWESLSDNVIEEETSSENKQGKFQLAHATLVSYATEAETKSIFHANSSEHIHVLEERKIRMDEFCRKNINTGGAMTEISGYKPANFSYCIVQKAGCTLYIRILKYLNGESKYRKSPLDITKFQTHYLNSKFFVHFNMKHQGDFDFVMNSFRSLTVRNPYTRLWSAYIDKFILPDFWSTKGKEIIRRIRHNATTEALRCGKDVTFSEFVQYIILTNGSLVSWNQDKHWLPASDLCDPCRFKPHLIGKQETFLPDLIITLQHLKLESMLTFINSVNPTEFEIKDEIDYNFRIFPLHAKCTNKLELAKRIWTAFQFNGYLPLKAKFPDNVESQRLSASSFYRLILDERKKINTTKEDIKRQRIGSLKNAYLNLSKDQIWSLKHLYHKDFEAFGYDENPDYLPSY
ncbi:hypothetical protein ACJMK2_033881 [Sinanodonta woodiana]|uniref:Carbohydrate sulfotransferase n=1 Tax=Sinanodonta woodiana TaxID=1069815 RepID=A0ABD3WPT0_SINWO